MLFEEYIYILALEMASPGNQHCVSCIGTLSFRIVTRDTVTERMILGRTACIAYMRSIATDVERSVVCMCWSGR